MFSSNTELGIMEQANVKLKALSMFDLLSHRSNKRLTRPRSKFTAAAGTRQEANHRL